MDKINLTGKRKRLQTGSLFLLTLPQITLLLLVVLLLVLMVSVCTRFTSGAVSTNALQQKLRRLQQKFASGKVNPLTEREAMELLHNKVKTTSSAAVISGDADLKWLFYSNCRSIQAMLSKPDLADRTAWIKLNALMVDFNTQYFGSKVL